MLRTKSRFSKKRRSLGADSVSRKGTLTKGVLSRFFWSSPPSVKRLRQTLFAYLATHAAMRPLVQEFRRDALPGGELLPKIKI